MFFICLHSSLFSIHLMTEMQYSMTIDGIGTFDKTSKIFLNSPHPAGLRFVQKLRLSLYI